MIAGSLAAVSNADVREVCGPPNDQKWLCAQAYRVTGSRTVAQVAEALSGPLRILFVVVAAWIAARIVQRVITRTVDRIRDQGSPSTGAGHAGVETAPVTERALLRRAQRAATVGSVLRNIAAIVVWSIAVLIVLGELGIDLAPLLAGAGIVGIALGFGTQSIVRDYLAGLFVVLEDQYGVGDEVDTGEANGTVEWVSLRMTRLRDADGVAWYVPNGEIKRVGNFSRRQPSAGVPNAPRDDETQERA